MTPQQEHTTPPAPAVLAALQELVAAWEATHFELPTRLARALAQAQRVIAEAEAEA